MYGRPARATRTSMCTSFAGPTRNEASLFRTMKVARGVRVGTSEQHDVWWSVFCINNMSSSRNRSLSEN
jgi:hypothetical protein